EEPLESLDALDAALALGALEDDRGVVAALGGTREPSVADGFSPSAERVEVARVVHRVDAARPRWPRADLAEDRLAARLPEPLHVREARLEAERAENGEPHVPADSELGDVGPAQGDRLRADPLDRAPDERARTVPGDVPVEDLFVRADGVEGELLALDEFLDADLLDVLQLGQDLFEGGRVVQPVRVRGARSGDRLDDRREADARDGLADRGRGPRAVVLRGADVGGIERLLHLLLVAERDGLRHSHPRDAQLLAQAGRDQHARLPEALDAVEPDPA